VDDARITNRGSAYGVGADTDHYGVWDLRAGGDPVARFPRTDEGWLEAWARFEELEARFGTAGWRSGGVGWILLHIVIGLGIGLVAVFLATALAFAAGRDTEGASEGAELAVGSAVMGMFAFSLGGWLLFVYLRRSVGVRLAWFLGPAVVALAALTGVMIGLLPRA